MPSYFFHVKIDLIRPASNIASILQRDTKLLQYHKLSVEPSEANREDYPNPSLSTASSLTATKQTNESYPHQDWRAGVIYYEGFDMLSPPSDNSSKDGGSPRGSIRTGLSSIYPGLATKARFEPSGKSQDELGYGIVRLFRDTEETPGLYDLLSSTKSSKNSKKQTAKKSDLVGGGVTSQSKTEVTLSDQDFTTLCILTIPSWWDTARLMAFVGEKARDNVSHFRMIRTEPLGRYMLLMKFRNGKTARDWRKEWNGKVFDPTAPTEYCHVVFVKSVEICEVEQNDDGDVLDMLDDPFRPKSKQLPSIASLGSKPMPPPTRPLKEMPTCPVCLERMDESSGLLTIPCQHTFHCVCLVKWRKNGCPVCRFTQDDMIRSGPDDTEQINECSICRADTNLWICLICGNTGCGRYDRAHAYLHWKQSGHAFSMDMADQSIWDYASDGYVHRIMQNKIDGKMMELPSAAGDYDNQTGDEDVVPRAKFEAMGSEYTQLLMSQLDSQRTYFERKLESAADKASEAAKSANQASDTVTQVVQDLSALQSSHATLLQETIPSLERDRDRADRRATKFEAVSRHMEKQWREEKAVGESLLEKTTYQDKEIKKLTEELVRTAEELQEIKDTNHDLMTFVSGRDKIQQMNDPDINEGTILTVVSSAAVVNKNNEKEDDKLADNGKKKRRGKHHKNRAKGGREDALNALGKQGKDAPGASASASADEEGGGVRSGVVTEGEVDVDAEEGA